MRAFGIGMLSVLEVKLRKPFEMNKLLWGYWRLTADAAVSLRYACPEQYEDQLPSCQHITGNAQSDITVVFIRLL